MPVASNSRTRTQVAVTQGAAGSLDLAAAAPGLRIYVTRIVVALSAAGTLKFQEGGTTDLTGAIDLGAAGGFVVGDPNGEPVLFTITPNTKLNLVSTVGLCKGWIHYFYDT